MASTTPAEKAALAIRRHALGDRGRAQEKRAQDFSSDYGQWIQHQADSVTKATAPHQMLQELDILREVVNRHWDELEANKREKEGISTEHRRLSDEETELEKREIAEIGEETARRLQREKEETEARAQAAAEQAKRDVEEQKAELARNLAQHAAEKLAVERLLEEARSQHATEREERTTDIRGLQEAITARDEKLVKFQQYLAEHEQRIQIVRAALKEATTPAKPLDSIHDREAIISAVEAAKAHAGQGILFQREKEDVYRKHQTEIDALTKRIAQKFHKLNPSP